MRRCASDALAERAQQVRRKADRFGDRTPGIRISEKPTPDAPAIRLPSDHVVPSIVIRSVVKLRRGKRTVWPPAEREAAVSVVRNERPPSNWIVARVIHRLTELPRTCTRFSRSAVTG